MVQLTHVITAHVCEPFQGGPVEPKGKWQLFSRLENRKLGLNFAHNIICPEGFVVQILVYNRVQQLISRKWEQSNSSVCNIYCHTL